MNAMTAGGQLQLRDGDDGRRLYLQGRGVHAGDHLELRLFVADDKGNVTTPTWISVRIEGGADKAYLHIFAGGYYSTATREQIHDGEKDPTAAQAILSLGGLVDGLTFRWPERERR